jgi:glycosyltransferase involved in cell wall biosynthesis
MSQMDEIDFCLLIPCYNNFPGLIESLRSVVYPDSKYLTVIVDDGSSKPIKMESIKAEIGDKNPTVILSNETNKGITEALNKGLAWIEENVTTKYIARLDCSDTCAAERFIVQVQYLDDHPETGLLGSWCKFQEKGTSIKYSYSTPVKHKAIMKAMHFRNVFIHPTVMFRVSLLKEVGYYPLGFKYAEDYAFFWKLILVSQSFILDKFLVICEINRQGLSFKNRSEQLTARWRVIKTFSGRLPLKIAAFLKLKLLYILPKGLVLRLKSKQ